MDNSVIEEAILLDFIKWNNVKDDFELKIFRLYVRKAVQSLLNLTNRKELVKDLQYIVLEMVNEFYQEYEARNNLKNESARYVSKLSEADGSIEFSNIGELQYNTIISKSLESQLQLRQREINRFKKLYRVDSNGED